VSTMPPQRLALLKAILAALDDDLPRLVFADWLEENGTTDADAARVEFIRLGCRSKEKPRITTAEGKWIDENWRRILPQTITATPDGAKPPTSSRRGRYLRVKFNWWINSKLWVSSLSFEYVRGFARRVEYLQGHTFQRFWLATATDEPLAYHRPELLPQEQWGSSPRDGYARLWPESWGEDVFTRSLGYDELTSSGDKRYVHWPQGKAKGERGKLSVTESVAAFYPLAVDDEVGLDPGHHRQRAAVATAMTALAREHVGLAEPAAGG
jgi:uncharacterized protein (TIGR02996 family)